MPPRLVIVGSINMDLVARVQRLPKAGETVVGRELFRLPGGKGANQAVAAARLGAETTMVGRVGDDAFAGELRASMADCGVRELLLETPNCSSGVALIGVEDSGQNAITAVGGANDQLSPSDIEQLEATIARADALLVQLEVPPETVLAALKVARRHKRLTVLDAAPAPADELPEDIYKVDVISPNETETKALTGLDVDDLASATRAAECLLGRGAGNVVIKLGERGALLHDGQTARLFPAFPVDVVDTTAAGDAFTAALTLALVEGRDLDASVRFACAAGGLAATRLGAQQSMPARSDVDALLHSTE